MLVYIAIHIHYIKNYVSNTYGIGNIALKDTYKICYCKLFRLYRSNNLKGVVIDIGRECDVALAQLVTVKPNFWSDNLIY